MTTRAYAADRDLAQVQQIWLEAGWIESSDAHKSGVQTLYSGGHSFVAPADGELVEAVSHWTPGSYRWLDREVPCATITGILTGRAGRRQGFASEVVAEALAHAHDEQMAVSTLGAFEQGFYDRFGYGTETYEPRFTFDPRSLKVPFVKQPPVRLTLDDAEEFHQLLQRRYRTHGAVTLDSPSHVAAEWQWIDTFWGLGFRDVTGRLTHAIAGDAGDTANEYGPYTATWFGYEAPHQVFELLGLLRNLSDQLMLVEIDEPAGIRLQDYIELPKRQYTQMRLLGAKQQFARAYAWQQTRMLDIDACFAVINWPEPIRFNVALSDPLADRGGRWRGLTGDYVITIDGARADGGNSGAERGIDPAASTVTGDVGALTQLWTGARSATAQAIAGRLAGPADLLHQLDRVFSLPAPNTAGLTW